MKLKITKKLIIYTSLLFILILIALSGTIMSQVNEPKHKVLSLDEHIEIREYAPILVAQVSVTGERKNAISAGFRILADYIFGNNEGRKKIAMTAPVEQQEGEKISMTAPVIQQESLDNLHWNVRFVMPSEYTIETLPRPKNKQIEILSIPSKRYAVIRFSGLAREGILHKNLDALQQYIGSKKLHEVGKPVYAFYNPPWTLPFLRRNEIMIEIRG
jgi:effector-binding domain-containing protein